MKTFADRVHAAIARTSSHLVAGCDPVLDKLPSFILDEARAKTSTNDEFVEYALNMFSDIFLAAIAHRVAAAKPNIAFFEQYGLPGLAAFSRLCGALRTAGILNIIDAKRGDIGSTAAAYSAAFLGATKVDGHFRRGFDGDALTVNPFMGFDTLLPFIKDCEDYGKGLFILVQTSNPGAAAIQGLEADGRAVREHVAEWIASNSESLTGLCGWSGLGAVVGASYPEQARRLRELMPRSIFLIPGLGAQGASAQDSVAGFGVVNGVRSGALINVSRGLLEGRAISNEELISDIANNVDRFNLQISAALHLV